jgi:hypothetical protein
MRRGKRTLTAPVVQYADQIDHRTGTAYAVGQHDVVVHISADHIDGRQQNQILGAFAIACRHAHAQTARSEQMNNMPPDKTTAANHTNIVEFHRCLSRK